MSKQPFWNVFVIVLRIMNFDHWTSWKTYVIILYLCISGGNPIWFRLPSMECSKNYLIPIHFKFYGKKLLFYENFHVLNTRRNYTVAFMKTYWMETECLVRKEGFCDLYWRFLFHKKYWKFIAYQYKHQQAWRKWYIWGTKEWQIG